MNKLNITHECYTTLVVLAGIMIAVVVFAILIFIGSAQEHSETKELHSLGIEQCIPVNEK